MTSKQAIALDGGTVYGPYTPGVRVGDSLWLSGQIAPDAGDLQAQVAGALAKIDALLAAGGASKHDLVAVQVLLEDIGDFAAMNEVYAVAGNKCHDCNECHGADLFYKSGLAMAALHESST